VIQWKAYFVRRLGYCWCCSRVNDNSWLKIYWCSAIEIADDNSLLLCDASRLLLITDVAYCTVPIYHHSRWYSVRVFDCCDVDVNKTCWDVELIMMHSCILVSNLLVVICSHWAWLNMYTWSSYYLKVVLLCFIVDQRPTDIAVYI